MSSAPFTIHFWFGAALFILLMPSESMLYCLFQACSGQKYVIRFSYCYVTACYWLGYTLSVYRTIFRTRINRIHTHAADCVARVHIAYLCAMPIVHINIDKPSESVTRKIRYILLFKRTNRLLRIHRKMWKLTAVHVSKSISHSNDTQMYATNIAIKSVDVLHRILDLI